MTGPADRTEVHRGVRSMIAAQRYSGRREERPMRSRTMPTRASTTLRKYWGPLAMRVSAASTRTARASGRASSIVAVGRLVTRPSKNAGAYHSRSASTAVEPGGAMDAGRSMTGETGGAAGFACGGKEPCPPRRWPFTKTCHAMGRRPRSLRWRASGTWRLGTGTRMRIQRKLLRSLEREGTRPCCATVQELSSKVGEAQPRVPSGSSPMW